MLRTVQYRWQSSRKFYSKMSQSTGHFIMVVIFQCLIQVCTYSNTMNIIVKISNLPKSNVKLIFLFVPEVVEEKKSSLQY